MNDLERDKVEKFAKLRNSIERMQHSHYVVKVAWDDYETARIKLEDFEKELLANADVPL